MRNIGTHPISGFPLGVDMDADVHNTEGPGAWGMDDISGLLVSAPNVRCPEFKDPLYAAWTADNDGDPKDGKFRSGSPNGAFGMRLLETPPVRGTSFNWWTYAPNWGPARTASGDPVGVPTGDRAP